MDEDLTEAEIDAEFARTQPIGNAINALYRAELAVAGVDELRAEHREGLDQVITSILDQIED